MKTKKVRLDDAKPRVTILSPTAEPDEPLFYTEDDFERFESEAATHAKFAQMCGHASSLPLDDRKERRAHTREQCHELSISLLPPPTPLRDKPASPHTTDDAAAQASRAEPALRETAPAASGVAAKSNERSLSPNPMAQDARGGAHAHADAANWWECTSDDEIECAAQSKAAPARVAACAERRSARLQEFHCLPLQELKDRIAQVRARRRSRPHLKRNRSDSR